MDKAAVVQLTGNRFGQWLVATCDLRPEHVHMLVVQEVTGATLFNSVDLAGFLRGDFSSIPAAKRDNIVSRVVTLAKGALSVACALLTIYSYIQPQCSATQWCVSSVCFVLQVSLCAPPLAPPLARI